MVINRYSPISMHAHTHIYTYIHTHMVYQKIKACLGSLVTEWIYMKYPFSANTFFLKCWLKIERNDSFSWTISCRFLFKQSFSRLAILTFLAFLLLEKSVWLGSEPRASSLLDKNIYCAITSSGYLNSLCGTLFWEVWWVY